MPPSLSDKLTAVRTRSAEKLPPEKRAVMLRAIADLTASRAATPTVSIGTIAPEFILPDSQGCSVSLQEELRDSWVILTFFRGAW